MGPAELHNTGVNLDKVQLLDILVAQALTGRAAIAATYHQHAFDCGCSTQGGVNQSFVVLPFLTFRRHPAAIEHQTPAVALASDHGDSLERADLLDQDLACQPVTHASMYFVDPAAHRDPSLHPSS
jgi:hypothetical protein